MTVTTGIAGPPGADARVIEKSWADPEQFATIFDRYFGQIHRYLARRVGGKLADDLAADVFVAAFVQRTRYDLDHECARPWLYGIATNLVGAQRRREQRYYRALARSAAHQAVPPADAGDRVADRVSAAAAGPALAAALATLAPGDRDVLLLVALAELSYPEVAAALGIPYGTVCSRLSRARRHVRSALGDVNPMHLKEPTDG